jgi:CBS domain containing-hemolysin-like protein
MTWFFVFLVITILILLTALYVAAEFSAVSARRPRLVQMAAEGNRAARSFLPIVRDPRRLDDYIAACQVGITIASLVLGYYGQARLTPVIAPWLSGLGRLSEAAARSIATSGVLVLLTALQMILGELVPKAVGIQYPERLAILTAAPMRWSMILFRPLIWIFNGSGRLILRLFGKGAHSEHFHLHNPQELMMLFEESSAGGALDQEERRLLKSSLELRQLAVRQVMIPRNRMLAEPAGRPCRELLSELADSHFSRLLLFDGTVDNVSGFVHLKDLLCLSQLPDQDDVRPAIRPVLFLPETLPVDQAFARLQRQRIHVAIVLDEYGGTAGMVTLEDLIEEIFGELQDEFDPQSAPPVRILSENQVQVRGDMRINELNELLELYLPTEDIDTIGGLVLSSLGSLPRVADQIEIDGVSLQVDAMDGRAVTVVRLTVSPEQVQRLRELIK